MSRTQRKPIEHEERPPTISHAEGKRRFETMILKGRELLGNRPIDENASLVWGNTAVGYINETFGTDNPHVRTFIGTQQMRMGGGYDAYAEREVARKLEERIRVLTNLIELIDMEAGFGAVPPTDSKGFDFWTELHPDVQTYAKPRFEAGHFADAVEAAFKHINEKVKGIVLRKTSKELDGASLMRTAFSPNSPVIVLDDQSTETGRNIQQGYMDIFAGSMTGIRNPKAHANINIDSKRAMHLLFLASLLSFRIDERL